jgi:hypothetical protein
LAWWPDTMKSTCTRDQALTLSSGTPGVGAAPTPSLRCSTPRPCPSGISSVNAARPARHGRRGARRRRGDVTDCDVAVVLPRTIPAGQVNACAPRPRRRGLRTAPVRREHTVTRPACGTQRSRLFASGITAHTAKHTGGRLRLLRSGRSYRMGTAWAKLARRLCAGHNTQPARSLCDG